MDPVVAYLTENWYRWLFTIVLIPILVRYGKKYLTKKDDEREKNDKEMKAIKAGVAALLLKELCVEYTYFVDNLHYCPIDDKKTAENIYNTYHNLGGNGIGTKMYETIINLPTEKEDDDDEDT